VYFCVTDEDAKGGKGESERERETETHRK